MSKTRIFTKTSIIPKKPATAKVDGILITGPAVAMLRERAKLLGGNPEDMARRILEDYLKVSADENIDPGNPRFVKAADDLMRRHAELYKRLAK